MVMRVFVDADVLYSKTLYDWLFRLRNAAGGGMFTVGTSEDVLAEAIARYRDKNPEVHGRVMSRRRELFESSLDEIIGDYDIEAWMLERDPGDSHVRAACVAGSFDMLLTSDGTLLGDREAHSAATYEPITPDEFFVLLDDSAPGHVNSVVQEQYEYFFERHGEVDLPGRLRSAYCTTFATRVGAHLHALMSAGELR